MAYQYAGFEEESTPAAKLAMLNRHITEAREATGPDVTDGDVSVNRGSVNNYVKDLMVRRKELELEVKRSQNRGPVYVQKARPGCEYRR